MKQSAAIAAFLIASLFATTTQAANLVDIYRLALENDPILLESDFNRSAALEGKPQARAGLLPSIGFSGQFDTTDSDSESTRQAFTGGPVVTSNNEGDADRRSWTLQISQPLFRWDRWIALKRADKEIAQSEADYAAAKQDLAVRVTRAYFDALAAQDSLEASQADKTAIARQLEQAETRFEVGLIAITDVYESRAAYDQSVASEIVAKRTLATALEGLREITGSYAKDIAGVSDSLPLVAPQPANQDAWVQQAMNQNLSLESSRLAVDIAGDDIKTRRTGHYPTLDLVLTHQDNFNEGNSFSTVPGSPTSGGVSDFDGETDTIALQFSVPIYSGGGVSSQVRQAVYRERAAKQRLERVARQTERQTRDAYLGVVAEISRVNALKQSLTSSETALRATEAGFDVGTRTSVDVLNSRRDLLRAQTNYKRARYDYLLNVALLRQAAGTLSIDDLSDMNQWLTEE